MVSPDFEIEVIELNDSTKGLISSFDCDFEELRDFLNEDALEQSKNSVNKTYLWVSKDSKELVAYVAVCVDAIVLGTKLRSKMEKKGIRYKSLPALKIGRLAVNKGFAGKGIGKSIIGFAAGLVGEINKKAGCRFIVVDSKNYLDKEGKNPVDFYLKMGFSPIKEIKGKSVPMFLDTMRVIR